MRCIATLTWLSLLLIAGGCAGVPEPLDRPLAEPQPTLAQAQADSERVSGAVVRWGGTIVTVENTRDGSIVEVVARPLDSTSRPSESGASPGRFLVVTPHFIDPEIYTAGRAITATGPLAGVQARMVGEYEYDYPVVRADAYHLWPPRVERRARHYDPFWDYPWVRYPYWGYPYYHPYYRW